LAVVVTGYALGRRLLVRFELDGPWERVALRTVVGLAAVGWILTLLALAARLTPAAVIVVAAAAHLLGWTAHAGEVPGPARRADWRRPAIWATGVLVLPMLILPFYPPLHHDAGMYHLPFIRALAEGHRLAFQPQLRFPAFPQLGEVVSVPAYWLAGDAGAQVVHLAFGVLTALLLLAWGRRLLPEGVRLWPAATWVGNPLVVFLLGAAYVDLTLSCFVTAGAMAWTRWRESDDARWLAVAGGLLGSAVAVKYLAMVPLFVFAVAAAVRARPRVAAAARFAAWAAGAGGPMILWITLTTGNPVFPFLPWVFGETAWSWTEHVRGAGADASVAGSAAHGVHQVVAGLAEHLAGAATLPYRLLSGHAAPDAESLVSLVLLLALGLGILAVRTFPALLTLEVLAATYALVWSSLNWPDARFALPVAPVSTVLAVIGLDRFRLVLVPRLPILARPALLSGLAVLLAAPGVAYAWGRVVNGGVPPVSAEARMQWLAARRGEIAAVDLLNRTCPQGYTVYGLYAENARYFARGTQLGDWVGPHSYHAVLPLLDDPPALATSLCAMGADHLLVVTRYGGFKPPSRPDFPLHFRSVLETGGATLYEIVGCARPTPGGSSP